jgi:hypothetical protein
MKPRILLFCILHSAFCLRAWGQYSIDWSTIDGGGGTSTGGVYSVSGTIGQPDAGAMSGGGYSVSGGFWGILGAVQTPGAPVLRVALTSTNTVLVAWPTGTVVFTLQQNGDLTGTNWVNVGQSPVVVGGENQVVVAPPTGNRFYRLKWP